ncbi:putative DNA replication/checkpoint protein [Septoria linicola]|nr:putative DNA replication/checkpoint protein [Septoria linicola]
MLTEGKENHVDPVSLRVELKGWENGFREQNGRKAGREDIKKDAVISAKYKLYNDLTRPPKPAPPPAPAPPPQLASTPSKRSAKETCATPRKTPIRSRSTAAAPLPHKILSPVQQLEPEPTPQWIRAALGPTPQRDGQALGLFDLDDDVQETPWKTAAGAGADAVAATPSKGTSCAEHVLMKSPDSSSGKRYMFAAFAGTPLKRKRDGNDMGTTSSSKRKFATPSFLRRCNPVAKITDDDTAHEPVHRPPFQKRGLVRSLSSIIQNLKKQQDKEADDEWDIMNEIEAEERGETVQKQKQATPEVQVEDSQAIEMPLGPDQAPESSEEDNTPGNENQPGRKPWKKKGLKRQTRRSNMKPVFHKARKEGDEDPAPSDAEQGDPNAEVDEFEDVDNDDSQDEATSKPKKKRPKGKDKVSKEKEKDDETKKKPRKVNAEAHANYRRLNIKNKNSKAKGRGGRFGRR